MPNEVLLVVFTTVFAMVPQLAQAAPVDVNGDGKVGSHEIIDLSHNWKGPALPPGEVQPWQVEGKNISFEGGNVRIGEGSRHSDSIRLNVLASPLAGSMGVSIGLNAESNGGSGIGVLGNGFSFIGVLGPSELGTGVEGFSVTGTGVKGRSREGRGVWGDSMTNHGVYGHSYSQVGVIGESDYFDGVWGISNNISAAGVSGHNSRDGGLAGFFGGNVIVTGSLSKPGGSFRIDHPLDPQNKYLSHSFVESPDMMNIYNGIVVLDSNGEAEVELPDWFMALNKDYRYQLTSIGGPGPNLYIAQKVEGGRFGIAGGSPGLEVSWQLTGIRQDAWAMAHPIEVEKAKAEDERGKYLAPIEFGQPKEKGVYYQPEINGVSAVSDSSEK